MVFGGDNAESYYDEGVTAAMKGDLPSAMSHFARALERDSSMTAALHQLGKCHLRLGQVPEAVQALHQAVRQKPGLLAAHIDLGYALLDAGEPARAGRAFADALKLRPDQSRATLGQAYCAFQSADWISAATLAQTALQSGGANFAALFLYARAARLAGLPDFAEAMDQAGALADKVAETSPEQPEGHYLRAEVAFAREDFVKALEYYGQAEACAAESTYYLVFNDHFTRLELLARRGLCQQRLGLTQEARQTGEALLRLAPEHPLGKMLGNPPGPGTP